MKVLWITNTIFPDLSKAIGQEAPVLGGWMYGLASDLAKTNDIELYVATAGDVKSDLMIETKGIIYYLLKGSKPIAYYDNSLAIKWIEIINTIKPDLVHIHGTEFAHGLALMRACPNLKYVISIQGLTSVISRYYFAGIKRINILKNITIGDIIKGANIITEKKSFHNRGKKVELEYLRISKHIIGRTDWDFSHVKTINPKVTYHFCNASLRDSFYNSKKWSFDKIKNHTLFLSQAGYPIKGLHKVIEAANLLIDEFPDLQIKVAGGDILKDKGSLINQLKRRNYGKYILKLLKKYNLRGNIYFTGPLDEKEMIAEYLNSSIFISPSSIENESNSVSEAQFLGVPCIASYVGGVTTTIEHYKTGLLYPFEEVEMLAQFIKKFFTDKKLVNKISLRGMQAAKMRHDRNINFDTTIEIYKNIISQNI